MTNNSQDNPLSALDPCKDAYTVEYGGYIWEFCPSHPKKNRWGFVQQHRLVVERSLHRFLRRGEMVHHKDEDKTNNSIDNLQVVSREEHMAIHRALQHDRKYPPVTRDIVRRALAKGGLKAAARELGCDQETIRNNFPDLVAPYKRKSPANLDDPSWVEQLRSLAADENIGYREAARLLGISAESIGHILKRNNIAWVRKSKAGEVHSKYVRKGCDYADDPDLVRQVRQYAADKDCSYDTASRFLGISISKIQRIAKRNGISWVRKDPRFYPSDES